MSVGVGQCQNEICGNFCLQSQWLASVTAHPLTTASLKPGARFPNQIRVLFVLCAAATRWMMGQNWRKPFHTSREGGCKDKGDDVVRMASITINYNTALGAQRTCHRFCLFELLLLLLIYKETFTASQIAMQLLWQVVNQILEWDRKTSHTTNPSALLSDISSSLWKMVMDDQER